MSLPTLLITGASGLIGSILWQRLAGSFQLFGLDLHIPEPQPTLFKADIADAEQVAKVLHAIGPLSCMVHLAADPRPNADWPSVLKNNIIGTRTLYEAAKRHAIPKVIFASSNHVTGAYEGFPPSLHTHPQRTLITIHDPLRPDGDYGVSKAFGEALARLYYEHYGIASICLRIGAVLKNDDPTQDARHRCIWLSHRDLLQLVTRSIQSDIGFGIYYGVSNNANRFWDIANAVEELGYRPEDDASRL